MWWCDITVLLVAVKRGRERERREWGGDREGDRERREERSEERRGEARRREERRGEERQGEKRVSKFSILSPRACHQ